MEAQQLVDYISEQMRVGYSESTLREHLSKYGWQSEAIDDAFIKYHRINTAELKAARAARRKNLRGAWTVMRRLKVSAALLFLMVGLTIGGVRLFTKHGQLPIVTAKPLSYEQKQSYDVNMIAGAIAQYAAEVNALPTVVGANQGDSVNLCGVSCSADSTAVVMTAYKPADIKFASYSPQLSVPNQHTMYLVPGAKCANQTAIGAINTKPRSMVILYAQAAGSSLAQHCVVL